MNSSLTAQQIVELVARLHLRALAELLPRGWVAGEDVLAAILAARSFLERQEKEEEKANR